MIPGWSDDVAENSDMVSVHRGGAEKGQPWVLPAGFEAAVERAARRLLQGVPEFGGEFYKRGVRMFDMHAVIRTPSGSWVLGVDPERICEYPGEHSIDYLEFGLLEGDIECEDHTGNRGDGFEWMECGCRVVMEPMGE